MNQFHVLINNVCAENLHVLHKCYFIAHCTGSGGSNFPDSSFSASKLQIQGKHQGLDQCFVHLSQIKFFHIQLLFLLKWQWGWKRSLTKNAKKSLKEKFAHKSAKTKQICVKTENKPCNTVLASMYLIAKMLCKMLKRWITRLKNI